MRCDYNSTSAVYVITQKNLLENNEMAEVKSEAVEQYQELSKEWVKGKNRDNAKISSYLTQLKMSLTGLTFLPTRTRLAPTKSLHVGIT